MGVFFNKIKKDRMDIEKEYEMVGLNPIVKSLVQSVVMILDIFIMMVLIWNMFALCIPPGSWFNIVDGTSMEPTMHSRQILYTDLSDYGRGDIITAYMPEKGVEINPTTEGKMIVKRVIGVPGDRIIINEEGIFVNGDKLSEDYITESAASKTYIEESRYNSVKLNDNQYFIVGDNRGASLDSRYFGAISTDDILYKQSLSPTKNFYLKLAFIILVFALDIYIYMLIERILTKLAYEVLYKNKKDEKKNECDKAEDSHITSETVILKSERR